MQLHEILAQNWVAGMTLHKFTSLLIGLSVKIERQDRNEFRLRSFNKMMHLRENRFLAHVSLPPARDRAVKAPGPTGGPLENLTWQQRTDRTSSSTRLARPNCLTVSSPDLGNSVRRKRRKRLPQVLAAIGQRYRQFDLRQQSELQHSRTDLRHHEYSSN
jgi:hypothetical protein